MSESFITTRQGTVTGFVGPDAVDLFRAVTLRSALGLLSKGICPTRGLTMTKALKMVNHYTGKKYKRTEAKIAQHDLTIWIETMKSTLPVL